MQDLKFRVYNKNLKKWYESELLIFCNGEVYADPKDFEDGIALNPDEIHVMQYVGLTDSNGIEMFDGDIVKICNPFSDCEDIYVVKWFGEQAYPAFDIDSFTDESNGLSFAIASDFGIFIIGNIHDNPQLVDK